MKKLFFTVLFLSATTLIFAQGPIAKGGKQLNLGLGLSSWGLPIYAGMDFGIHKDITLGGEISFRSYNNNGLACISGNGNYHFNSLLYIPTNWDFYAGLNLGMYVGNTNLSGFDLGAQIGGRYYFNSKFGINLEFKGGTTLTDGKFGISIRL